MKKAVKKEVFIEYATALNAGSIATIVNGKKETEATPYNEGDILITGTLGEIYPMSQDTFNERYEIVGNGTAVTKPVSIVGFFIPAGVEIIAEWGAQQKLPVGSFMVVNDQEIAYGIDPEAFSNTYEIEGS